jgi:hypothetical protein
MGSYEESPFGRRAARVDYLEGKRKNNTIEPTELTELDELHADNAKNWRRRMGHDYDTSPKPWNVGDVVRELTADQRLMKITGVYRDSRVDSGRPGGWTVAGAYLDHSPSSPDNHCTGAWADSVAAAPLDAMALGASRFKPLHFQDNYFPHLSEKDQKRLIELAERQSVGETTVEENEEIKVLVDIGLKIGHGFWAYAAPFIDAD